MKPAQRNSAEIKAQLDAFLATLPATTDAPPSDDFAARLQHTAWQNLRMGLERELDEALRAESAALSDTTSKGNAS